MNDFLLDENDDLMFENGDMAVGNSDTQNKKLLLMSDKGDWKQNPTACVGAAIWLKDDDPEGLLAEIKKEFERDGMTVIKLQLTEDGKLYEDAHY